METTFGYDIKVKLTVEGQYGTECVRMTLQNVKIVTDLLFGRMDVEKTSNKITNLVQKTYPTAKVTEWSVDWKQERI